MTGKARAAAREAVTPRVAVLVPWRTDDGPRARIWAWCRARWEAVIPGIRIYEGRSPDGPFNRSAALNDAAAQADADGGWDLAMVIDADIAIDPDLVRRAIELAASSGKTTWAFRRWNGLTEAGTAALLESDPGTAPIDRAAIEKTNPISWSCCFVVPRATWEALGGFDERFAGWGWEDLAFQSLVVGLYGHERLDGDLYHLWHPRAEERIRRGEPPAAAYVANRMLGRRYMHALRVLGYHDRAVPSDEAEMERDRANIVRLVRNEELDALERPRPGLPDWRGWWPSLEELRDSWLRRELPGPPARLAIVVRSGGTAVTWPARREYLIATLASLNEHVHYSPVVARVLFSDWPSSVDEELREIAAAAGFYVVGKGNQGFTGAMRSLWRYLASRSWPFDYVWLAEDDFTYERDVPIAEMIRILARNPHLAQLALLRDAFYAAEREKGGILGHPVDAFEPRTDGTAAWLEHRRFLTLNPTLIRKSLLERPWPQATSSERIFGDEVFRDPAARSALWGAGETWIRHLGEVRAGAGY